MAIAAAPAAAAPAGNAHLPQDASSEQSARRVCWRRATTGPPKMYGRSSVGFEPKTSTKKMRRAIEAFSARGKPRGIAKKGYLTLISRCQHGYDWAPTIPES
eukprot:COSAG06_NODE_10395_length_1688_cov_1.321586_3_plen_102_part_00